MRGRLLQTGFTALVVLLASCRLEDGDSGPSESQEAVGALEATAPPPADRLRDAFWSALRRAAMAGEEQVRAAALDEARATAGVYASAWGDSFLVRRLTRFEAASSPRRRDVALADSLWRMGRTAYGAEGVPAAMRLWRRSLAHAASAADTAGRAVALGALGAGFYSVGALDSASVYLVDARRLAAAAGDHRALGNALANLGSVSKDRGDLAGAAELYEEATAVRTLIGDSPGMASDQNNLGLIAWTLGDLDEARRAFERALAINREQGSGRGAALNLTNLGDLASLDGDYETAEDAYSEALEINRAAGESAEVAFVLHDLGLLATRRGDYRKAIAHLTSALELHERSGATLEVVAVRRDLAAAVAATGDLEGAVATLADARRTALSADAPAATQAGLALAEADLDLQLGWRPEAEAAYERAERLYAADGDPAGVAEARQGRGLMALLRGNHEGAIELFALAVRGQEDAGDRRAAALTSLLVGDVRREMGDTATARQAFEAARVTLEGQEDLVGAVAAIAAIADLEERAGAPLAAEALYRTGLGRLGERAVPDLRWRLHAGLAGPLRTRGAWTEAAGELRAAIAAIEGVAAGLRIEERRASFLADKWDVYGMLARVEQAGGRAGEAFSISERMRGRQALAMLARGRVARRHPATGREQDLRRRIDELTTELEMATSEPDLLRDPEVVRRAVDATRESLDATQRAYATLLIELREDEPAYADLVSGEPVGWTTVAGRLKKDDILLEYLLTDSGATLFVVTRDTVAALDLGVARDELAGLVEFARRALGRPDGPAADPLWRAPLRRLHRYLIEPVERAGFLAGKARLVIVPHAELHFLPFGALLESETRDGFLIERFDLLHSPSASLWLRLGERGRLRPAPRVLALAPLPGRLPGSAIEVDGLRRVYGRRATILRNDAATERALRTAAPRHDILHLATFGVLNKHNPLFSYVELAAAGDDDGRLEVHEVFDLELDGQLVVLSACQTALGSGALADVPAGDDWVGLMQAFLQAGAGSVLASLWPVEDRATARLMQEFYRRLAAGGTPESALRGAQRAVSATPGTSHPFYWAGFVLTGASSD